MERCREQTNTKNFVKRQRLLFVVIVLLSFLSKRLVTEGTRETKRPREEADWVLVGSDKF